MTVLIVFATWITGSIVSAELLGYWLHRLLHSGAIGFLSRSHMRHHLVLYGPLQQQRSTEYQDATTGSVSLGNIGTEWLVPAAILTAIVAAIFHSFRVRSLYQCIYFGTTWSWSFLMFSTLHDLMHIKGIWLERNRLLRRWFRNARMRHDVHHCSLNDDGLMDRNFGIGFFLFDRLFGTFSKTVAPFNHDGYRVARKRFQSLLGSY
jgi:sterol desaturase/sphingolipid hydroxylase (fatty acid hydroxylase superfamily)